MPAFRYEAVDAQGATRKGVLNADSPRSARAELRVQGLVPLAVEPIAAQVDAAGVIDGRDDPVVVADALDGGGVDEGQGGLPIGDGRRRERADRP